ncbi:hypothetical protein PsorP6_011032 [Peronosclerospora sorghi]|uniref:Uncharacterized protein n=1 Tax=Peronosclerospora sorghi TaxID=230839 RepID=A0ACC0VW15_9STRA|nr:hypothetical protein PsorP6_011032 [Peronosclerospora sorghi]
MQLFSTLSALTVAVVTMALVLAEQEAYLKLRIGHKFTVNAVGKQCAYDNCVDPSMYPCAKSVCVRVNYTYGYCSDNPKDMSTPQDLNDPKLKCPRPNPYS